MNKGKLEVVKQKMPRVNIDILGISELKWTGMGECNLDDHDIYYCGQESLRRNEGFLVLGFHHSQQKSPKWQYLDAIPKMAEWYLFISRQTIQYHSDPSLCPD